MPTSSDVIDDAPRSPDDASLPAATLGGERKGSLEQITLLLFIAVPFVALVAAVPLAWAGG
jgi:hypothetical protein